MAKYGVFMLDRLILQYSRYGGSSQGMRAYLDSSLSRLQVDNPQLRLSVAAKDQSHPQLIAHYRSGRKKAVCVKNYQPSEIHTALNWLKDSHGRGQEDKVISKRQLTRNPSIQGMWSPQAFPEELRAMNEARLRAMKQG